MKKRKTFSVQEFTDVSKKDKLKVLQRCIKEANRLLKKAEEEEKKHEIEQDIAILTTGQNLLQENKVLSEEWFNLLTATINKYYYKRIPLLILLFLLLLGLLVVLRSCGSNVYQSRLPTGTGKYTIGVKGKIPSKYVVSVIPDETITMMEENNLLDSITADVTAEKTTWVADELSEDSYAESTENTIQMQSIDFAKFNGTLNFNISATMPVELKDASDAVKAANKFIGVGTIKSTSSLIYVSEITEDISAGDIIYVEGNDFAGGATYKTGYYSIKEVQYAGSGSASEKNLY